jgi:hypothetical protein
VVGTVAIVDGTILFARSRSAVGYRLANFEFRNRMAGVQDGGVQEYLERRARLPSDLIGAVQL